jgi:hypothetical protein
MQEVISFRIVIMIPLIFISSKIYIYMYLSTYQSLPSFVFFVFYSPLESLSK